MSVASKTPPQLMFDLSSQPMRGLKCAVTGAAGFVGAHLVRLLLDCGASKVLALDIRQTDILNELIGERGHPFMTFIQCDVRDKAKMNEICGEVDVFFHTASYFGSPTFSSNNMGDHERVMDINVRGTQTVIEACLAGTVSRLVYTSSVNVVFAGEEIVNGTEELPYPTSFVDPYGASKAAAEQAVIAANGKGKLRTASLRPNGIWGPHKASYAVSKLIDTCAPMGGLFVSVGTLDPTTKTLSDWTYVDNLTQASVLAAVHLGPKGKACGQVYNIVDDYPINTTEFSKDILERCGYSYNPVIALPAPFVRVLAVSGEWFAKLIRPVVSITPPFTKIESLKVLKTHYFSCEKAKEDLGYKPIPWNECMNTTANYFAKTMHAPRPAPSHFSLVYLATILGMLFTGFLALAPPSRFGDGPWSIALAILNLVSGSAFAGWTSERIQTFIFFHIWWPAMMVHTVEGIVAMIIALETGDRAVAWGLGSLLYGSGSLFKQLKSGASKALFVLFAIGSFVYLPRLLISCYGL